MTAMKGTSRRVWLTDLDMQMLQKISEETNLGQTELLSQMIHASLISITENQNRMTFPLRFTIRSEAFALNETPRYAAKPKART